jgi:hypothetical protein
MIRVIRIAEFKTSALLKAIGKPAAAVTATAVPMLAK